MSYECQDDRIVRLEAEVEKLEAENAALRTALADAISSPMGVVPASAEQFYEKGEVKP